jgi:hypothetical protein
VLEFSVGSADYVASPLTKSHMLVPPALAGFSGRGWVAVRRYHMNVRGVSR